MSRNPGVQTQRAHYQLSSAGLAIGDYSNLSTFPVVPEDQIQPYVQEAINQIHFITGDAETNEWAKLRAEYGHPEPYKLKYIEIGNEDTFVSVIYDSFVSPTDPNC